MRKLETLVYKGKQGSKGNTESWVWSPGDESYL
jgi:hypothetical protein